MRQVAAELHLLLREAKEKPPYILVGQSLGGLMVRTYANEYPKEVVGMVLLDSSHENNQIMLNNKMLLMRELSRGRQIPLGGWIAWALGQQRGVLRLPIICNSAHDLPVSSYEWQHGDLVQADNTLHVRRL